MNNGRWLSIIALLLLTAPVCAQQQTDADSDAQQNAEQQAAEQLLQEGERVATEAPMPDLDNQPIERVEGQAPGRFIPSEQISQDLGVSFPTDI